MGNYTTKTADRSASRSAGRPASRYSSRSVTVNPDTNESLEDATYINPKHIVKMVRDKMYNQVSDGVIHYIYWSIIAYRKYKKPFFESAKGIAKKLGLDASTVRSAVHRTKLIHRQGGVGERKRSWLIGPRPEVRPEACSTVCSEASPVTRPVESTPAEQVDVPKADLPETPSGKAEESPATKSSPKDSSHKPTGYQYYDKIAVKLGDGSDDPKVLNMCMAIGIQATAQYLRCHMAEAEVANRLGTLFLRTDTSTMKKIIASSRFLQESSAGLILSDWESRFGQSVTEVGYVQPLDSHPHSKNIDGIVKDLLGFGQNSLN